MARRSLPEMRSMIAKLLAKAGDASCTKEERAALTEKAESLMMDLGIARAELESVGEVKPEKVIEVVMRWPGNYAIEMVPFVENVASGFGHLEVLYQTSPVSLTRRTYIIGLESDVQEFVRLMESLYLQVRADLRAWQRENVEHRRDLTDQEKYLENRSFIRGFGLRVGNRLHRLRAEKETAPTVSTGAELVLVGKAEKIADYVEQEHPGVRQVRRKETVTDTFAYVSGVLAGETADIHQNRITS